MSQPDEILDKLIAGETLTPLTALLQCHTLSLSQRCGELRRRGYEHEHKTVQLYNGKRVGHYWMTRKQQAQAKRLRRENVRRAA